MKNQSNKINYYEAGVKMAKFVKENEESKIFEEISFPEFIEQLTGRPYSEFEKYYESCIKENTNDE